MTASSSKTHATKRSQYFSLLVVTTGRVTHVHRLFRSLAGQTYNKFNIIFVHEKGCAGDVATLLEEFQPSLEITTISIPKCGVSHARNIGLPYITGEYVAFPDDDCWYPPDALSKALQIFTENPSVDALLGRHHSSDEPEPGAEALTVVPETIYSVFGHSETFLQFYRRACVDAVGDFDEKLGAGTGLPYGCGEDTDYVVRTIAAGFSVSQARALAIRHPAVDLNNPILLKKTAAYAHGRMYLLRKHNFPLWFRLSNVLYPLLRLPIDVFTKGCKIIPYRWSMFFARLRNF